MQGKKVREAGDSVPPVPSHGIDKGLRIGGCSQPNASQIYKISDKKV